ncbi:MAG: VanZ family protein [Verrucomicrobiota bacterium]
MRRLASIVLLAWVSVAAWTGVIWFLSSCTGRELGPWMLALPHWDKVCHFIAFFAGGVAMTSAVRWTWRLPFLPTILISMIAVSCYGAVDEWHQLSTPGRSGGDLGDWTFDTLGAIAGTLFIATLYARYFSTRSRSTSLGVTPGN